MKDHISQHLTSVNPKQDAMVAKTPVGMAFWSGTGPELTTCRTCIFYTFAGYKSARGNKGGMLKSGPCKEFVRLTNVDTHKIPHETQSCKFYKENKTPPTIIDSRK